jgi:D-aminoacyl-tRNA deacylase
MRAVLQRVVEAKVEVSGHVTGSIGHGLLVLLGIQRQDTEQDATQLLRKITGLRIFNDEAGKMNRSVRDVSGSMLIVSQFTVYGDCTKGMRPSFDVAARPETARVLYEFFVTAARSSGIPVETGVFQASMKVSSINDGPVTLICDSGKLTAAE